MPAKDQKKNTMTHTMTYTFIFFVDELDPFQTIAGFLNMVIQGDCNNVLTKKVR